MQSPAGVRINDVFCDWVSLHGGMPQGSLLGHLVFIILVDDLRLELLTHKSVDDTTVSEIIVKDSTSVMQPAVAVVIEWSKLNFMNINCKKTKELIIGPLCKEPVSPLSIMCEHVTVFKLLGITVNSSLNWDDLLTTSRKEQQRGSGF